MKTTRTLLLTVLAMAFLATGALAQDRGKDKDRDDDDRDRPTHSFLGIDTHPFAALVLSRPSGPDDWSTGFQAGVEIDFKPIWLGIDYTLHDILTEDEDEVYPWTGTLDFKVGLFF